MSRAVDQRVVSMQFDNQHFEKNVATTMSTLDKLKQSLQLKGVSNGLSSVVDSSAKTRDSMQELEYASYKAGFQLKDVVGKFFSSAEWSMARGMVDHVTNAIKNLGNAILGLPSIKAGFSEYETQMGAIQTILANTSSKGTTLDDVNGALDELNTYADKTIYNFTEMTKNIGTFTAAGVDLDTSVSAIKGIANLAAVSGSTSQQASTAMYQLSQAMASGTVKLMDWNSVVNAGMGGQIFQDALKETAKVHGIAIDEIIDKQGSFRESLSEGWLTTEILTETLSKFTGDLTEEQLKSMGYTDEQIKGILELGKTANDAATKVKTFTQLFDTLKEAAQSGWSQTWEIIIGDFEEAKKFLTEVSDTLGGLIGKSAESRNSLLEDWKTLGGRDDLIESLRNVFQGLLNIIEPIGDAWRNVFPATTAKQLVNFTKGLRNLTQGFKEFGENHGDKLERILTGVFSVLKIGIEIIKSAAKAIGSILGAADDLGIGILDIAANIGDLLAGFSELILSSDIIGSVFRAIGNIIKVLVKGVAGVVKLISGSLKINPSFESFQGFLSKIADIFNTIGTSADDFGEKVVSAFESAGSTLKNCSLIKIFDILWNGLKAVGSAVGSIIGGIGTGLSNVITGSGFDSIFDLISSIASGGILVGIWKLIKSFTGITDAIGNTFSGITGILDSVKGCLVAWQTQLKADALLKIAGAIAILTVSLVVLAAIDSDKLTSAIGAITMLFVELMGAMAVFTKISGGGKGFFGTIKSLLTISTMANAMTKIAISVLILAAALKMLSDLETDEIIRGIAAIAGLAAILVVAAKAIASGGKAVIKGATKMVIFSAAIAILASVCKSLAKLSWEELAKGLVGVGVLLAEVSLFMNTAKFSGKAVGTATGIVILAAAIKILASACANFGNMEWGEITKGLTAIGALLLEIALFTRLTGQAKHVISTGIAVIALSAGIKIMASAMRDLARLSWEELAKGLVATAGALAAIVIAMQLMPKNIFGKGMGLLVVATSLLILSAALDVVSGMSWEDIAKGMVAVGGSMLILAVGLHAMKGALVGALSLTVAVGALSLLVPILILLGSLSWENIAKALITIAGAFIIIGVAAKLLSPAIIPLLGLAAAMVLIGASMALAGAGLLAVGAGLTALAAGIAAIVGSLGAIVSVIVGVTKAIILGIAEGIVAFCEVIIQGAPAIGEAILAIVTTVLELLVEIIPSLAESLFKILLGVLEALGQYIAPLVEVLLDIVIGIINALAEKIGPLVDAVVELLFSFIQAVISSLADMQSTDGLAQALLSCSMLTAIMLELAAMALLAPLAMVGVVGMGLVIAELAVLLAAIGALAQIPGLQWLISEGGNFLQTIGNAIGKFVGGIIGGIGEGISASLPAIADNLSDFMQRLQPFIDGAKLIDESVVEGVKSLVDVIVSITAANLLESIASFITGESSITAFAEELPKLGEGLKGFSDSVAGIVPENIVAAAQAAKALADMASTIPNEGGIVAWFAGENSLSKFASDIGDLGEGLKSFSDSVTGIVPENITAAAEAAKAIASISSVVPNQGGVIAWFAGENSLSKFAMEIVHLGVGLKSFSIAVTGLIPENVIAAANAAKALADMASVIPNQGGVVAWFSGDNSISKFAGELPILGRGLKAFSVAVTGIIPENIVAAANAAKSLADMASVIPNQGGVVAWFSGENSISKFSEELPKLGKGLSGFGNNVKNVNPEVVSAAALAAKGLAEMVSIIPTEGGIKAWFSGEHSMSKFASELPKLGSGISGFAKNLGKVEPESVKAGASAAKSLAEMTESIPKNCDKIKTFGNKLENFGKKLKVYFEQISGVSGDSISTASKAIEQVEKISKIDSGKIKSVAKAIEDFTDAVKDLAKDVKDDLESAGKKAVEAFIKGVDDKLDDAKKACKSMVAKCGDAIEDKKSEFETAGKNVVAGFVDGIDENTFKAEAKAAAMAKAALKAAKAALDEHSPSKEFYKIGRFGALGLINALADNEQTSYNAGYDMATYAKKGLSDAMSKVTNLMNNMDSLQPTIRPVLDLSDVRANAGTIGNILGAGDVGMMANVGTVSSMMRGYNQNGAIYEVVSAFDKLRGELGKTGDTYTIGNVTYDDGSNVAEAVKSLVRAARVERRV